MDEDLALAEDIRVAAEEFNLLASTYARELHRDARAHARTEIVKLLEETDNFRDLARIELLGHPEGLAVLRSLTCPPLTQERLSGLSRVPIKRIYSLERGQLPVRPSGGRKLLGEEIPRIITTIVENLDSELVPWVGREEAPSDREMDRLVEIAADRFASLSDIQSKCGKHLGENLENDVERWLVRRGYLPAYAKTKDEHHLLPAGTYSHRPPPLLVGMNGTLVTASDFVVNAGGDDRLAYINVKLSQNATTALRTRAATDLLSEVVQKNGGVFVQVLGGLYDAAYVRHQREKGTVIAWHHRLDDLRKVGL